MTLGPDDLPDPSTDPTSGPVPVPDDACWVATYKLRGASMLDGDGDVLDVLVLDVGGYLNGDARSAVAAGDPIVETQAATMLLPRNVAESLARHLQRILDGDA